MIYTVKSKKDLEELIEILEEEGISLSYKDNHLIDVHSETEKDFDVFSNILSFYVSYINFQEQLIANFIKKGVSKKEAEKMVDESLFDLTNSHYFYTFTRVLVKEYFKKMQTFNVDSFSLFNMKGFKDEVKLFAESTIQFQNEHQNQQANKNLDLETETGNVKGQGIKDLFSILRERGVENGLKLADYQELHIFQQGNFLHFKNKDGIAMDNDFLLEYLGSALEFEIIDEVDNPELFEGMMISSVLINIFDVKKVVVHKSVTEKAKEILTYNITSLKKETGKRIKVIMCNGCDKCE
ncbi:hypothetical protein CVD28_04365 [Bacillus sp. M6-12]|uniref:hypothetical protein n=1 Tax=Bacillus sp. M6-12 TaxID=2054166 RepID=UPI000C75AEC9|nr:hypothetical protein [Bacillus sp. M6-12]PLS19656.1 hypothetical protein CVD28_04365 [Bacillus sp. M6-12]